MDLQKCTSVVEGKAHVDIPDTVFYNKVQQFNRDLTVHVINTFLEQLISSQPAESVPKITILDALSATGLRSIRYALECGDKFKLDQVVANDISKKAINTIDENIAKNGVANVVKSNYGDAATFMYLNRSSKQRFTIVDIDPYGCPAMFLDAAVQSVADGGLLMVTSTDLAILCGNHSSTCHAKYGSVSLKSKSCHEMALRIILRSIEAHANRYGRFIKPLISLSIDFYARVFVQVFTSPAEVKRSASKLSYVYQCVGCESFELQPLYVAKVKNQTNTNDLNFVPATGPVVDKQCQHCNCRFVVGGPIWNKPIHSQDFVENLKNRIIRIQDQQVFGTQKRLFGLLHVVSEELLDIPLYYCLDKLCRTLHCRVPPTKLFRSALLNAGFSVSYSHASKTSIKTNAPNSFLWDVIKQWCKTQGFQLNLKENSPGFELMKKDIKSLISFELHPLAEPLSKEMQLVRFQVNPEENWGPKSRPSKQMIDKRAANQGKRTIKQMQLFKDYPCKKFQKGECDLGDDCRYNHNSGSTSSNDNNSLLT